MAGSLLSALSRRTFDSCTNAAVFSAHVAANTAHGHSVSRGVGFKAHPLIHALSPCKHQHTHTTTTISLSPPRLVVCEHTLLPVEAWRVDAVCVVLHVDEEVHLLGCMQQPHHKRRARTARLKRQRQSREVGHIRLIKGAGWKGETRSKGEGVFLC